MGTINSRIEELISILDITKTAFAEKIKVTQPYISKLIAGNGTPSDRLIEDICEKYNVNEVWLRSGKGEMFEKIPEEDEYFKAVTQISKSQDDIVMQAIIEYWKLDDASKQAIQNYIKNLAESITKK